MSRSFALVFLVVIVLQIVHGCLCPPPFPSDEGFFQAANRQATTVVRAVVLSSTVTSPGCTPLDCSGDFDGERVFSLRLVETFKGVSPAPIFEANTVVNAVRCGINLNVGTEYMLNMGGADSNGSYFLWLCQYHREWDSLSEEETAFLQPCKRKLAFRPSPCK